MGHRGGKSLKTKNNILRGHTGIWTQLTGFSWEGILNRRHEATHMWGYSYESSGKDFSFVPLLLSSPPPPPFFPRPSSSLTILFIGNRHPGPREVRGSGLQRCPCHFPLQSSSRHLPGRSHQSVLKCLSCAEEQQLPCLPLESAGTSQRQAGSVPEGVSTDPGVPQTVQKAWALQLIRIYKKWMKMTHGMKLNGLTVWREETDGERHFYFYGKS